MGASSCKTHPHKFLASRTQYLDHKTAINFSRLESFAIYIPLFCSFYSWVTCSVKTRRAMTCDRSNAARKSSLCCCDRTSLIRWLKQCQKSGQKADYIQCRARLASFGAENIAQIGENLWKVDSIVYLTDIPVRGRQTLYMEPFMRLLVCECGYHWRLRVNTCAKVDGAQHPQGK